jgi:PqqD family protein of HPr-rel-A system
MKSSNTFSPEARVVAASDLVATEVDNEVVILSLRSGEYHGLNPVAASIWSLVQEPSTIAEVCDSLLAEYDGVTAEQCEEQVLATLTRLRELGLVEVH